MPLDEYITFRLRQSVEDAAPDPFEPPVVPPATNEGEDVDVPPTLMDAAAVLETLGEMTFTVANLEAAERAPVMIPPDAHIDQAITTMDVHNYSQLVVGTSPRNVKGIVSFKSIVQAQFSGNVERAGECIGFAPVVYVDEPLLQVVAHFREHDAVLVKRRDESLCGIVTPSDIAAEYGGMTGPFLLIGEIEGQLRWLAKELTSSGDETAETGPDAPAREPDADSFTLGQIQHLLQKPHVWNKLGVRFDRGAFSEGLDRARRGRNSVMHFREPLDDQQVRDLESFAKVVRRVCRAYAGNAT